MEEIPNISKYSFNRFNPLKNIPLSEHSLFSEITEKSYTFVENIHLREYDNSQRAIV